MDSMDFTESMFEAVKADLYGLVLAIENRAREFDIPIDAPHDPAEEPVDSGVDEGACGFWITLGDVAPWRTRAGRDAGATEPVDVMVQVVDAEAGAGEGPGCTVSVDVVAYEGELIGGCTPYNYTDQVWVRPGHPDPAGELRRRIPGPPDEQAIAIIRLVHGYWRQKRARKQKETT